MGKQQNCNHPRKNIDFFCNENNTSQNKSDTILHLLALQN